MSSEQLTAIVLEVLQRAPDWVRADLGSNDRALRTRAEEVLAILIATALGDVDVQATGDAKASRPGG